MNPAIRLILCSSVFLVLCCRFGFSADLGQREHQRFDADWRFSFGHATDTARDFDHATSYFSYVAKAGYGDGPAAPGFDDRAWRILDLPHDWAVEAPFAADGSHSHGYKAIGRRYPERSIGWYRKKFAVPASDFGRRISIEFDGVFRDSVVWINGFYLGRHATGSMGFSYDLTDYINYGGDNVVTVRADATMEEGWYYEGAGIYRHVWLSKTAPLHVARWGTFVSSTVKDEAATLSVVTTVLNDGAKPSSFTLEQILRDPSGAEVSHTSSESQKAAAGSTVDVAQTVDVTRPQLWSPDTPTLYELVTVVKVGAVEVDRYQTRFGIRTVRFDPNQGFFLNGKHLAIKGTNNHQDYAGVGVAVPDALHEFRIKRLKEMGCNAYRTSHEPPTPELLDACDRLGMLVLDENRLMATNAEQFSHLESLIRRDRNHPSVIIWSLGNEEWAIEGNEKGARVTATMRAIAERLDPTRRSTVAISGGWGAGSSTTADVMGYNYYTHGSTDEQHAKFPDQPGIGTEETSTQCTRGVYFADPKRGHLPHNPEAKGDSGGNCILGLKHFAARPYLAGLFFWTGFDYRGEPTPFGFPAHSTQFGLFDTCGFPKDSFYYLRAWWTEAPVLHIYPHWNWARREGQPITVGCYTNHEEVELFLNGRSLGRKPVPKLDRVEWSVPYEAGVLEVHGYRGGKRIEIARQETSGPVAQLVLNADRKTLLADGTDATVISVEARDVQGRTVPTANSAIRFHVTGGKILGVGNGDPSCLEPDQFHSTILQIPVSEWRGRIKKAVTSEVAAVDELKSLHELGDWKAALPKSDELYELTAEFVFDGAVDTALLDLFLPALGSKTTVYLNGREMMSGADTSAEGPALRLDPAMLAHGKNQLRLLVTPFDGGGRRLPQLARLGCLRITVPPPVVQRSLFNGFAQVVVQSSTQTGEIVLTAESVGLKPATTMVRVTGTVARE
ncbi:MAG: beta-galactosidase GalA [Nibricoccus sp.]